MSGRSDVHPPPLPSGPAAEVDAGPEGPDIGAFFDLDGTLVAGFTVAAVTRDRLRRREVGAGELLVTLGRAEPWELDGEVMGSTRQLTVVAQPGALLLRMPPESA